MITPLPSAIRVEAIRDTVRYILPRRALGKFRWIGLLPLVFGTCFLAVPLIALAHFFAEIIAGKGRAGDWIAVVFVTGFAIAGALPFFIGVLIIWGRCKVEWREGRLTITDFAGPVRWRRRLPKGVIRKFAIHSGGVKVNDRPVTSGPLATAGALIAEYAAAKPRVVLLGFPRAWLEAVAADLSARIGVSPALVGAPVVTVASAEPDDLRTADVVDKPAGSILRAESRAGGGVLLVVPPSGLWKGTRGMFVFAIMWCSFMVVFTAVWFFADAKDGSGMPFPVWLFIAGFWAIGFGLLAGAMKVGRRRAMVLAENGRLVVAQRSLFGSKRHEWPCAEVSAIRADASGMTVNDVPVIELQIHLAAGKKAGFFAGRDDGELRWMATELRRALNVPAEMK